MKRARLRQTRRPFRSTSPDGHRPACPPNPRIARVPVRNRARFGGDGTLNIRVTPKRTPSSWIRPVWSRSGAVTGPAPPASTVRRCPLSGRRYKPCARRMHGADDSVTRPNEPARHLAVAAQNVVLIGGGRTNTESSASRVRFRDRGRSHFHGLVGPFTGKGADVIQIESTATRRANRPVRPESLGAAGLRRRLLQWA